MGYLLDTNIISAQLKKNEIIREKLRRVELQGEEVFISCVSYYEVKRGLLSAGATRQMSEFDRFCRRVTLLFLDDLEIIERACEIHADLKRRGRPIQDADILIAATAITRGLVLVSNDSDMLRVPGVPVENWLLVE
ncbi:type II toxin-antitoxin system VapC family toxin [Kamptonema formosum]|uniref:type II toxin-antitoxin system VapC family toxin n=1 Tax=Kamptonema formosum TaxID=331992 RepID=UPI0003499605|nr:type II toxin-antitoxin system VapC family toxin [Oscillatoria sp. PCC 10802]